MEGQRGCRVSFGVKERYRREKQSPALTFTSYSILTGQRQACQSAEDKLVSDPHLKDRCLDSMPSMKSCCRWRDVEWSCCLQPFSPVLQSWSYWFVQAPVMTLKREHNLTQMCNYEHRRLWIVRWVQQTHFCWQVNSLLLSASLWASFSFCIASPFSTSFA